MDASTDQRLDVLQGWLLLLPFLALCLPEPWSLFTGAPDVISIGVGVCALGVLPALLVSTLRAFANRGDEELASAIPFGMPLLLAPLALAAYHLDRSTDTFNAWRALVGLGAATGAFMAASTLRQPGRRVLKRGLPIGTLLLLASTLLESTPEGVSRSFAGALGNTGDLAEAALPGAIVGVGAFLNFGGALAVLGLAALAATALYVGLVPVYAGTASIGIAFVLAFSASALGRSGGEAGRQAVARRARLLLVALLLSVLASFGRQVATSGDDEASDPARATVEAVAETTTTGGVAFRRLTWSTIPAVLADTGIDGAGPGQFQAIYPPYRNADEIELSSMDRREPTPQEVEHAHNDLLTALVEYGWLGGGALVLLLGILVFRALKAMAGEERARRDFAVATVAMVAMALFNAPLLYSPLSFFAAFLCFGVVASPKLDAPRKDGTVGLIAHVLVIAAVGLVAPRGLDLVNYGRTMAKVPDARVVQQDGREGLDAQKLEPVLADALSIAPDACMAIEKLAELMRRTGAPLDEQLVTHAMLLDRRPHSVAGLIDSASVYRMAGSYAEAATQVERALELDSGNPTILRNRARIAFDLRDADGFAQALTDASLQGLVDDDVLRKYANEALVGCRLDLAAVAVARYRLRKGQSELDVTDVNALFAASEAYKDAGDDVMRIAYRTAFNYEVALDHLRNGAPGTAVTTARLAFQRARDAGADTGATRLRLAAAHAAAGQLDEAQAILAEGGPIRRSDGEALLPEEREPLESAGLIGSTQAPGASISPR